jgi:glucose-1-phosphate thymidylyltransferase
VHAQEVIGLIPAAGRAARLGRLPCSKEMLPLGAGYVGAQNTGTIKVMLHSVLEKLCRAEIYRTYIILREGKWDIPAYFADGSIVNMHLAYLMLGPPFGVPYTLDQAYPFIHDRKIALGFGDILFHAEDAYVRLLNWQSSSNADVVLGLFPANRPDKVDMVELADEHRVRRVIPKPLRSELNYTWGNAVWTTAFTEFLHRFVEEHKPSAATSREPFVGDVIQAAIENGLRVEAVHVSSDPYVDIGTPDDLAKAISGTTQA